MAAARRLTCILHFQAEAAARLLSMARLAARWTSLPVRNESRAREHP
jgi:hypothetical protein